MGFYAYESHLSGEVFTSEFEHDYDDLYCDQCGDSDWPLGYFETQAELDEYLKESELFDE